MRRAGGWGPAPLASGPQRKCITQFCYIVMIVILLVLVLFASFDSYGISISIAPSKEARREVLSCKLSCVS